MATHLSINENIYGHKKRLDWIKHDLTKRQRVLEFGCGTGYMLTFQLLLEGYDAYGVDLDDQSIAYGKEIFGSSGLDSERLINSDIRGLAGNFDVIIASEVFEHISNQDLGLIIELIKKKIVGCGTLIVTVPNGYGWFELESFIWFKLGIGRLFDWLQLTRTLLYLKRKILGSYIDAAYPSTLSSSPHVQRFTFSSIKWLLKKYGFEILKTEGTVFFAGPISNLFFTGIGPLMNANKYLGSKFPRFASGFMLVCRENKCETSDSQTI